jgi:hypothetical protein
MQAQAMAAASEDDFYEQAVLRHVLGWQPTVLRDSDLIREVAKDPDDFGDQDAVNRAVRELVKVGLLFRQGECVLPTPALLYVQDWDLG